MSVVYGTGIDVDKVGAGAKGDSRAASTRDSFS